MFSHVMVGVNDLEKSRAFYDALLGTVGVGPGVANAKRYFYRSATGTFGITTPINGEDKRLPTAAPLALTCKRPSNAMPFMRPALLTVAPHVKTTGLARRLGWQAVFMLFARPRWQQDLWLAQATRSKVNFALNGLLLLVASRQTLEICRL